MTKIQKIFEYLKSNVLETLGSMVVITIIIVITLLLAFSGQWVWFQTFGATRVASVPAAAVMQADTEAKSAAEATTAALKSAVEKIEAPSPAPTAASAPTSTAAAKSVVMQPQSSSVITKHAQYCFVSIRGIKTKTGEVQVKDPNSNEQATLCRPINDAYASANGLGQRTGHSLDNKIH